MTHEVIIDGKEYVLNTQSEHKEGDPIPFMITKKDMEHFMNILQDAIFESDQDETILGLNRMKKAFQHMIDEAEKRGNWK